MSMKVSYRKQFLFFTIYLILLLSILEIIANIWWINETKCSFMNNEVFAKMNQKALMEICQDQSNIKMNEFFILPNQNMKSIHINNLGFRGSDFANPKSSDIFRIFFIGGSTAFGSGSSSDDTTIPGYLQTFFNQHKSIHRIEIINGGKSGFNTITEKKFIFDTVQYLQPDMIIMYDGWNDIRADHKPDVLTNNWRDVCDLGKENDFQTVIILQPTLAFGKNL